MSSSNGQEYFTTYNRYLYKMLINTEISHLTVPQLDFFDNQVFILKIRIYMLPIHMLGN